MARRYGNYSWQKAARYGRRSDKWGKTTSKSKLDVSPTPTIESYESALKNSRNTEKLLKSVKPIEGLEEMTFPELHDLYRKMYFDHYTKVGNGNMLQGWDGSNHLAYDKDNAIYKINLLHNVISLRDIRESRINDARKTSFIFVGLFVIIGLVIAYR